MCWLVLVMGVAQAAGPATGSTGSTGSTGDTGSPSGDTGLSVDADQDGYSVVDGDCDDGDAEVNPGATEVCEDQIDNDCNGLYDDGCDYRVRMGTLRGAGGCSDNEGGAALLLLPLFWLRRRPAASSRGDR